MSSPRLEIQKLKVRQVIDDYRAGRLVIPEFQREYVWKPSRAPRLLDSLYRGYPVSVLLLWTSESETRARRHDPRPAPGRRVSWLIDGQQRVMTLSRIESGDEGIDVVFNPEEDSFRLANAATRRDKNWFRVSELLRDDSYRQIRRSLPEGTQGERREVQFERVRRILDYEVPAVLMLDHPFDEAVESFTRINTLGVKLKTEDIQSARVAARHSGFIADDVAPFVERLRRQGFGRLNVMHLFRACAAVALPDGRCRTPLHELDRAAVMTAWSRTRKATAEAIELVHNELGLLNMDILWSGALLVPVIVYCALTPPRQRDPKGITAWLAMTALLHRYSKGCDGALDRDLNACRSEDPVGKLLGNVRRDEGVCCAVATDFKGAWNDKGAMFAAYVACRSMGIFDLLSGAEILRQANVGLYHIFPRALFPEQDRARADTVANIAFVMDPADHPAGSPLPARMLERIAPEVLESQCIPADRKLWRIERAEAFWEARRNLLSEAFNGFLRGMLPGRHLDAA